MGVSNHYMDVQLRYLTVAPLQWARELMVNSHQAGAKEIKFTTEWVGAKEQGIHRRVVVDDGRGMTGEELVNFFNSWGNSGQQIGGTFGNFGIGAKLSLLPWNKYGLIVISRSELTPDETNMIWLFFQEGTDKHEPRFGVRLLNQSVTEAPDMVDTINLDEWEDYPATPLNGLDMVSVAKSALGTRPHGTAVLMLGGSPDEHTIKGDPTRDAESSKYAIEQYFSNRFMNQFPNLKVSVGTYAAYTIGTGDNKRYNVAGWPTSPSSDLYNERYNLASLAEAIEKSGGKSSKNPDREIVSGEMIIPRGGNIRLGAKIRWYMSTGSEVGSASGQHDSGQRGDMVGLPITATIFEDKQGLPGVVEVFNLEARGAVGSGNTAKSVAEKAMTRWIPLKDVGKRCAIIVEPLQDEDATVFVEHTRRYLNYSVGGSSEHMPMTDWISYWRENMPEPIRQAIKEFYSKAAGESSPEIDHVALSLDYLPYLKAEGFRWKPTSSSTAVSMTADVIPHGKRKAPAAEPKSVVDPERILRTRKDNESQGDNKAELKRATGGLVQVDILPRGVGEWAVTYDDVNGVALVNSDSRSYQRLWNRMVNKLEAQGKICGDDDDKLPLVRMGMNQAVMTHITLAVTEILMSAKERPEDKDDILSSAALSNCFKGIRAIEELASGYVGHRLAGRGLKAKAGGKS